MAMFNAFLESNHRYIIASLGGAILLFLAACTFHNALPICHYIFGCDHGFHITG
ncbi:hypothetical protein GV827_21845 [Sulfitobacter sp. JBTF-M27]|uniref:Uncharacterized protein n=1 Tax=Sulfitobacter sediminilitoris TaxID=2698830 RepID=A0A6P0CKL9_9RHOB|nr:hypothetical protein [Sulfitobacter sediminilitoris]NEK25014.1 hypothetical protein [Sulfitobacter sediminilitoris]